MTNGTQDHLARILLLVDAFSLGGDQQLDGLTKLAKLDFLLRYPAFLETLVDRMELPRLECPARPSERLAVDSPMVRYRYGPWDDRYYTIIGSLVGRHLAEYVPGRGRVALRSTAGGQSAAATLRRASEWSEIASRVDYLHEWLDLPGTQLKTLIYDNFPSMAAQPWRSPIDPAPKEGDR